MKRVVRLGINVGDLWLAVAGEPLPSGARVIEKKNASLLLERAVPPMAHPEILHAVSDIAEALGHPFHGALPMSDLDSVMETLKDALRDGRLVAFHNISLEGGGKGPAPQPQPPKPGEKKSWIKLKLADDLALQVVGGVTVNVTLSDGQKRDFTTRNDGMIEITGIPPGTCDAADEIKGAKLPTTLAFMGTGETAGGKKSPDDEPIAAGTYIVATIEEYKVKKGDTLDSVATKNGLTWQDLAIFNFGTSEPAAVNEAVRVFVGSKTLAPDKKNFEFGDADKPGVIFIPKAWKEAGLATEKTHTLRLRPKIQRALAITKVDPWFAPQEEKLDIQYTIHGLAKKTVKLQITSEKYEGKTLFERDLTEAEKNDGKGKALQWDGKINTGKKKDRFASPSLSPFKVKLVCDATYQDDADFKILVHSLKWQLGDFDKGIFDDGLDTTKGQQQRLRQLGYYHGDLNGTAGDAKFKKAVEWFQSEHDTTAATKGTVGDSTKKAIKARGPHCIDGAALPADGGKAKVFVSGAFFYTTDADLNPGGHPRFTKEKTFWGDGIKIPVYAKIYLKKKAGGKGDCPKAVWGTKVLFDYADPADDAVLTGKQKDYVDKALDYYKNTTQPKGDNCHKDRGGKRGDDVLKVFPKNTDTTKFPFKVDKAAKREAAVIAVAREEDDDLQGQAGVIFSPSRMGGDSYTLRAFLHTEKDLDTDAEKTTAPDVELKTGKLYVWRKVRVNQYLHKTNAAINSISMGTVNTELAKAYMELTGELASKDLTAVQWTTKVTAALTSDADFATIGKVDFASLNTIDFKTHAEYTAAGGALGAAAYTTLCRNKTSGWLTRIMQEFAKDQYHGMTVLRVANGHSAYFTNSGLAPIGEGCYVWWPKATYDAKSYVVEKYALHEMGHCLFLRHHYTSGATSGAMATWPASDNPDDHDADDPGCAMSYYRTDWHLCGQCALKLRGWDEDVLSKNDNDNQKT